MTRATTRALSTTWRRLLAAVTDTLQAQLDQFHEQTSSDRKRKTEASPVSSEQNESLSALGYVGSSPGTLSADPLQGADPKDKIGISNTLHEE